MHNATPRTANSGNAWSARSVIPLGLAWLIASLAPPVASAGESIFIENATVLVGDGTKLERVSIKIDNGKITAIGALVPPSEGEQIDAEGKFVTPGLIDVWSSLAARIGAAGGVSAQAHAADAFDPYAIHEMRDALRQGVTAVYIPGRSPDGLGGQGAVVRLIPEGTPEDWILRDDASLCASYGVAGRINALGRLRALRDFQNIWQQAREYRRVQEDYAVDLKEYEEKVRKRGPNVPRAKDEEKKPESGGGGPEAEPDRPRRGPGDRPRRRPRPQPQPQPRESVEQTQAAENSEQFNTDPTFYDDPPKPEAPGEKKDEKKEEIKKPEEPRKDRNLELALDVIDGKIPLRVETERPEDILNVANVARYNHLPLILEGASGAVRVAEKLAEWDIPVVVGAAQPTLQFDGGPRRYQEADEVQKLASAGVKVYLGSGPGAEGATSNLALRAAATVGPGHDSDTALKMITSDAAELLGVSEHVGRVHEGLAGDLVIWSAHPFAPGAVAEHVIVDGREVFDRKKAAKSGE